MTSRLRVYMKWRYLMYLYMIQILFYPIKMPENVTKVRFRNGVFLLYLPKLYLRYSSTMLSVHYCIGFSLSWNSARWTRTAWPTRPTAWETRGDMTIPSRRGASSDSPPTSETWATPTSGPLFQSRLGSGTAATSTTTAWRYRVTRQVDY